MRDDIAIGVKNVTKTYRLYESRADRVKESFTEARVRFKVTLLTSFTMRPPPRFFTILMGFQSYKASSGL